MGALSILRDLQAAGVVFSIEGGAVQWRNGGQHMTPDRLAVLQAGKTEVAAALSTSSDDCRHGHTFDGTPKTWTGKVVSLAAWRQLSEWEKHGPDGRSWNGTTRRWEMPE